ncbi:11036_t:CDS:2, partial [Funneliformis geosporum]
IGRARRDGNLAHSFIFYAKGDTRSILIILTAGRASINNISQTNILSLEEESIDEIEHTEIIHQ